LHQELQSGVTVQIVCVCKKLVEVVDRLIVDHENEQGERCISSGMRYVSRKIASYPGGPKVEILAERVYDCGNCAAQHQDVLVKVTHPDTRLN
jgi:hypothetical protein